MSNSKVFAIISFICGLVSIVFGCFGGGFLFGIAAIVLGVISRKRNEDKKGLAVTGIITGIVGTLFSIVMIIVGVGSTLGQNLAKYM